MLNKHKTQKNLEKKGGGGLLHRIHSSELAFIQYSNLFFPYSSTEKYLECIATPTRKNLFELTKKYRLYKKYSFNKQINYYSNQTLNKNKNTLLGGGGCCSSSRTQINGLNQSFAQSNDEHLMQNNQENKEFLINDQSWKNQVTIIQNNQKNEKFEIKYKSLTNQETLIQSTLENNQFNIQRNLIQQCILNELIHNEDSINAYKLEIQDLFETYVILESSIISHKSDAKQEKFEKMLQEVESTLMTYENDIPNTELVFYAIMLTNLNKLNHKIDQNQQKIIKEFMNRILNFSKNKGLFEEIEQNVSTIRKYINLNYKNKEQFALKYSIEIWLNKIDEFKDKFIQISEDISQEIIFYVKIFFQIYKTENKSDEIILTLIRINYFLEKFQKDNSKLNTQIYNQFSNNLIKANFDEFLSELMQKSDLFDRKVFLLWSIENNNYRYITLSILININTIISLTTQNTQNQEYLLDFLLNKYLIEKELTIKVLFDKIPFLIQYFEKNSKNEAFKKRIINFDKQRKLKLLPYIENINDYEKSIKSFNDIIILISENAIEKWEREIKKRQRQNLAKKDDVLLEVKDLYINQMITYQKGNPIFQKVKQNSTGEENTAKEQNALQDILQMFLNPNYSYSLKYFKNNAVLTQKQQKSIFFSCFQFQTGDDSSSEDNQNEQLFKEESRQCKILGILAEGGTGKSMLMKKIETFLIEKLSIQNTETGNYLPLLIKCNSLDSKNPSLEDYLQRYGGINQDQIQNLKLNERNKLILLDGYDEYTGDYFVIYKKLNLNQWKNTKVIVATRKEKLSEEDASIYFSKQNEKGDIDEMSYTLVKLEEFTTNDIHEYAQRYFKQERKEDQISLIDNDLKNLSDCLTNMELEKLLHLPINLYLFTRMLVHLSEKEVQNLKNDVSDQIGIQEMFFHDQFDREAQQFLDSHVHSDELKKDQEFRKCLKNSYFEYFQTIAMRMLENRSVKSNYLQVEKENINFNIQQSIIHNLLKKDLIDIFLDKIKNYMNSKIVTRSKEEVTINIQNKEMNDIKYLIEFRHKSLFEYFAARAMKYDFDVHGDNIHKLSIEQLKEFSINKKCIMNAGQNQSEQQILIKLFKMIQTHVHSDEFYQSYHLEDIDKNSRYIQYIKKSIIKRNTDISLIDIGASNMLSALFLSKFTFPKLQLRYCSFSKLYSSCIKSNSIIFDYCNLQNSFLKNLKINYDSCNIQFATFDDYQKVFDTSNIFSFNDIIWDKRNMLYSITQSGFINVFKIENQNKIVLQKSKQFSLTPLSQILVLNNDTLLVSSQYSLLLIDTVSFELLYSYKFKSEIFRIGMIKENILVTLEYKSIFHGFFTFGFRKMNIIGEGYVYNSLKQILLVYSGGKFSLYNTEENFKHINTIQGHTNSICSVAFSADEKYLASTDENTCKIWNVEKDFELINTIHTPSKSLAFSLDGKYLATTGSEACNIWNAEKGFELIKELGLDRIKSFAFSADGKYLATVSVDKTCKLLNAEKGFELVNTIQGHILGIKSIAFSADGKYLATGSDDKTCKIWNPKKGIELTIQGHTKTIYSVAFSADGKYLATGSEDKICKIWNVQKGFELINTIQGHTSYIFSVAFSADGRYLATGSRDNTCKIWNAEKGFELINTLYGHKFGIKFGIKSVAFSANRKYLATGSDDKTCKIWNAEIGFELIITIYGHLSYIFSVAFSADGKYLATGSEDKTCKIWNAEKGFELINTIQGHTKKIYSVAFYANGKYLATGSDDYTCKIWNAERGFELINTIKGHIYGIQSVAFSVDGKYLATGSDDKSCKIWNAENVFELINTIQGHTSTIYSVAFSADGKYFATSSEDKTCKVWNTEKGFEFINTIQGHTSYIYSVAFSSDGKYVATGSEDKTCKIWNAEKCFELTNTIQGHTSSINSVAFSKDGKYLATGSRDNTCKIWNSEKGFELLNTILNHTSGINSVAFSINGMYLATGSDDGICKIWIAKKDFELINTVDYYFKIQSVAFSVDGKYLATASKDKCNIWKADKGFGLLKRINDFGFKSVAFSADGKYLIGSSTDHICQLWNLRKGFKPINIIQGHTSYIYSVAFSADGKYLATGSEDNTCKIWNAEKGFGIINKIQGHTKTIYSVTFSANGKYLASSDNKTCKIWNPEKGFKLINTIQGHTSYIYSVAFSADGKYLATGSEDNTCKIWNAEKEFELINTILSHTSNINSVAFSINGKYLATGSNDTTCKIWNAKKDFELINTIKGHIYGIQSVAFSVDGKYLATGSDDKSCKIWNAENVFELINTIQGHTSTIYSVAFSADGKYLATGSKDETCKIWNAQKDFELTNTIQCHASYIYSVAFSEDGKYLATSSRYKTCKIWSAEKGFELINTIQCDAFMIKSVAFSADGKYLATGTGDNTCKIWKAENGFELINTIQGNAYKITSVTHSSDGKYLAAGYDDKSCKIWNAEQGFELTNIIQGHTSDINCVAFSEDGKYLATYSMDKTCKIWNVEKGFELINTIQGLNERIYFITFSQDCKYICLGQSSDFFNLYDLQNFEILINKDLLLEKYELEQIRNRYFSRNNTMLNMRIFENMFTL